MVAYKKEEMVGITEFSKAVSSFVDKISTHSLEKLAIIKHNKPEVVVVSIDEYEKLVAQAEYLEDLEIAKVIKERVLDKTEPVKTYSLDEVMMELRQKGKNV